MLNDTKSSRPKPRPKSWSRDHTGLHTLTSLLTTPLSVGERDIAMSVGLGVCLCMSVRDEHICVIYVYMQGIIVYGKFSQVYATESKTLQNLLIFRLHALSLMRSTEITETVLHAQVSRGLNAAFGRYTYTTANYIYSNTFETVIGTTLTYFILKMYLLNSKTAVRVATVLTPRLKKFACVWPAVILTYIDRFCITFGVSGQVRNQQKILYYPTSSNFSASAKSKL